MYYNVHSVCEDTNVCILTNLCAFMLNSIAYFHCVCIELPEFEVCHNTFEHGNNTFTFCPNPWNIVLHKSESGVKCVNATATGYPNPQYSWSYSVIRGQWLDVSNDPCLEVRENGKV